MPEISLRKLEKKDAPYMLEWMKDPTIACFFRFDTANITENSCTDFIERSLEDRNSRHYAIVDPKDEYLGTISLKDIDHGKKTAEYAISTRKKAHGTGAAGQATERILQIAFEDLSLNSVFLNVLTENIRANAFYKKAGFQYQYTEDNALEIRGKRKSLNWYVMKKEDYTEHMHEQ